MTPPEDCYVLWPSSRERDGIQNNPFKDIPSFASLTRVEDNQNTELDPAQSSSERHCSDELSLSFGEDAANKPLSFKLPVENTHTINSDATRAALAIQDLTASGSDERLDDHFDLWGPLGNELASYRSIPSSSPRSDVIYPEPHVGPRAPRDLLSRCVQPPQHSSETAATYSCVDTNPMGLKMNEGTPRPTLPPEPLQTDGTNSFNICGQTSTDAVSSLSNYNTTDFRTSAALGQTPSAQSRIFAKDFAQPTLSRTHRNIDIQSSSGSDAQCATLNTQSTSVLGSHHATPARPAFPTFYPMSSKLGVTSFEERVHPFRNCITKFDGLGPNHEKEHRDSESTSFSVPYTMHSTPGGYAQLHGISLAPSPTDSLYTTPALTPANSASPGDEEHLPQNRPASSLNIHNHPKADLRIDQTTGLPNMSTIDTSSLDEFVKADLDWSSGLPPCSASSAVNRAAPSIAYSNTALRSPQPVFQARRASYWVNNETKTLQTNPMPFNQASASPTASGLTPNNPPTLADEDLLRTRPAPSLSILDYAKSDLGIDQTTGLPNMSTIDTQSLDEFVKASLAWLSGLPPYSTPSVANVAASSTAPSSRTPHPPEAAFQAKHSHYREHCASTASPIGPMSFNSPFTSSPTAVATSINKRKRQKASIVLEGPQSSNSRPQMAGVVPNESITSRDHINAPATHPVVTFGPPFPLQSTSSTYVLAPRVPKAGNARRHSKNVTTPSNKRRETKLVTCNGDPLNNVSLHLMRNALRLQPFYPEGHKFACPIQGCNQECTKPELHEHFDKHLMASGYCEESQSAPYACLVEGCFGTFTKCGGLMRHLICLHLNAEKMICPCKGDKSSMSRDSRAQIQRHLGVRNHGAERRMLGLRLVYVDDVAMGGPDEEEDEDANVDISSNYRGHARNSRNDDWDAEPIGDIEELNEKGEGSSNGSKRRRY